MSNERTSVCKLCQFEGGRHQAECPAARSFQKAYDMASKVVRARVRARVYKGEPLGKALESEGILILQPK